MNFTSSCNFNLNLFQAWCGLCANYESYNLVLKVKKGKVTFDLQKEVNLKFKHSTDFGKYSITKLNVYRILSLATK